MVESLAQTNRGNRRVANRFVGIRDFSYLTLGIRDFEAKSGRGSELKVSREVGCQKQTQGLRNYPKFCVEITGLKNYIGDPRIRLSQFQKLSLPNEIKSTSFLVKISLICTTTSKTLL